MLRRPGARGTIGKPPLRHSASARTDANASTLANSMRRRRRGTLACRGYEHGRTSDASPVRARGQHARDAPVQPSTGRNTNASASIGNAERRNRSGTTGCARSMRQPICATVPLEERSDSPEPSSKVWPVLPKPVMMRMRAAKAGSTTRLAAAQSRPIAPTDAPCQPGWIRFFRPMVSACHSFGRVLRRVGDFGKRQVCRGCQHGLQSIARDIVP